MARTDVISDFLVRLGFDGKEVIKGVAKTEAALKRLKKAKIDSIKVPKDVELEKSIKDTKRMIAERRAFKNMKEREIASNAKAIQSQKNQAIKAEQDKNAAFLKAARDRLKQHKRLQSAEKKITAEKERQMRMTQRQRHAEAVRLQQVRNSRRAILRSRGMTDSNMMSASGQAAIRSRLFGTRDKEVIKDINAQMGQMVRSHREATKQMQRQFNLQNAMKFGMRGLIDSVKNFARSWMSVFAVIGGALAGLRFTQQFQALDAAMLAVSENSKEAAQNVKFIKDLAKDLPVDIKLAGDEFKNLLASGRESVGTEGVKEIFTAFGEFGTALQVDPHRMQRALTAVSQIFNKGTLMAEEVKGQLGEQLPGVIQIFAKSLDMTTAEFFKAMEAGELFAADVMPKVAKEMRRVARNNDALTQSLKTSRSQWTLFMNNLKLLFDGFGSDRLDRGVASFIKMMGKLLEVLKPLAQTFFYLLGVIFDLVGSIGQGLLTAFDPLLNIFKALERPIKAVFDALGNTDEALMQFFKDAASVSVYFIPILRWFAIIGDAAEEFINIFTGHAQGIIAGQGETIGERLSNGVIAKGFMAILKWIRETFLPQLVSDAKMMGEKVGEAFSNALKDKLSWLPFIGPDAAEQNAQAIQGAQKLMGGGNAGPSQNNNSVLPRHQQIIINLDGEEKFNQLMNSFSDQQFKGAM